MDILRRLSEFRLTSKIGSPIMNPSSKHSAEQQGDEMDHGVLNVPLSKRGDIDAELDAYKAKQAVQANADRKAKAATLKAQKVEAKTLLASILSDAALLDEKAAKLGVDRRAMIKQLDSWAKWEPAKLIKLASQWAIAALARAGA